MNCFQRCLSFFHINNHILHTFFYAFQNHLKDGTESGTSDCCWFAAVNFIGRILVLYVLFAIVENKTANTLTEIVLGTLIIFLQPYKSRKINTYIMW